MFCQETKSHLSQAILWNEKSALMSHLNEFKYSTQQLSLVFTG